MSSISLRHRARLFALVAGAPLLASATAHANGGVLSPESATAPPSQLDVSSAVAVTPFGTTRWARITVAGVPKAMWLVPARPGAALDWSSEAWLDALDDASAPRILPPAGDLKCSFPTSEDRVATFGSIGTLRTATGTTVLATEAEARAHATARGFAIDPKQGEQLGKVYASGFQLVAFELDVPNLSTTSTPTLRVSDDGAAALPLALTGGTNARTRITAFVTASDPTMVAGGHDIDPRVVTWSAAKSDYGTYRTTTLAAERGAFWLRESSDRVVFRSAGVSAPSVVERYFQQASCRNAALAASQRPGVVRRLCPAGGVATVPGPACVAGAGEVDATPFVCGADDDLALALAGSAADRVTVSRFAGLIMERTWGADVAVTKTGSLSGAFKRAGHASSCNEAPPYSPPIQTPPGEPPAVEESSGNVTFASSDACGGNTTTTVEEGESTSSNDDGCGGSSTTESDSSSSDESCSGDSSSSSDSGSDDENDDDGWDSSDSSSSSKDDDSCGKSDAAPKKHVAKATGKTTKKTRSPVSRYALFLVAIVLPIRRRLRFTREKQG